MVAVALRVSVLPSPGLGVGGDDGGCDDGGGDGGDGGDGDVTGSRLLLLHVGSHLPLLKVNVGA